MAYLSEFWSGGFWIFPFIMMTFMMVIMILIIRAIFYRDSRFPWESKEDKNTESPLEISQRRYAKGEINKEEFEEIKRTLG